MTNQYSYFDEFSVRKNEEPQKKIAQSNISSAAKVYMLSRMQKGNAASEFRNGNDNGQKYMTSEDFVTYFQNRGKIPVCPEKVAKSTVSTAKVYRSRETQNDNTVIRTSKSSNAKKTYGAPNVKETIKLRRDTDESTKRFNVYDKDAKVYTPKSSKNENQDNTIKFSKNGNTAVFKASEHTKFEKAKKIADEWMPKEEIVTAKSKKSGGHFRKMIFAIAGMAISLLLIVSGSVITSKANKELKALDSELKDLERVQDELSIDLDMKNDVNVLRERAQGDLGMIRKEYVEANYLDVSGSDEIKVYEKSEDKKAGLPSILSAFGIN